jgi:UDP:flavonoid glycosyltransferase YjiC (YdhE family)
MMIAERLQNSDVNIKFSSFGEAAGYLTMHGYDCVTVPPVEFVWSMKEGFLIRQSIANIPNWFTNFSRQLNNEARNIIEYNPDIIISDSRLSPLVMAKFLEIPSVVILNQVKLLLSPRLREFRIARFFERMNGEILGAMWTLADKILVPDLPPPYTIAEHNIWDISSVMGKLQYIGLTAPKLYIHQEQLCKVSQILGLDRARPIVFIHISGPMETRLPIIRMIIDACKALYPEIQYVISEGRPRGDPKPKKLAGSGWYYEWCPVRDELFAISDLVVLRGGHVAISQAIQFGKPIVTIPIENHGEQLGNSEKIAKIGIGIRLKTKQLKAKQLTDAIHQVLNDSRYKQRANVLMKLTEKLDGIDNIMKVVRSYI